MDPNKKSVVNLSGFTHIHSQVVAVIEKRKHLHRIEKDPLSFEIWIFRNGQSD